MQYKVFLLILGLFFLLSNSYTQVNNKSAKLTGTLTNAEDKLVKIGFEREDGIFKFDSVYLDNIGAFTYINKELKGPTFAFIFLNNIQYHYILFAPGFNLKLTANALNDSTLKNSIEFTGTGSEINKYKKAQDKYLYKPNNTFWFFQPYETFLSEFQKVKASHKRIMNELFSATTLSKQWAKEFKKYFDIYYYFLNSEYLFYHLNELKYEEAKATPIIKELISEDFFEKLFNAENKVVPWHQDFLNPTYLDYLKIIDEQKEPGSTKRMGYPLNRINNSFKEPFRDKTMYDVMEFSMHAAKDLTRLRRLDSSYQQFYPLIRESFETKLKSFYNERETFILTTQKGMKAPRFIGKNEAGKTFTPESFVGKVVYIDFWASWCGPCRHETPFIKLLYDSLKGHDNFQLLSIAVSDKEDKWKNALTEDNVAWESILDVDNTSRTNYYTNNGIPKFVIINKKGNLVNFSAPRPSESMDNLLKIIREELERED